MKDYTYTLIPGNGGNDLDGGCGLEVGTEECLAANNMDHVLRGVAGPSASLAADLGMGDALAGIEARHGGLVADACRKTARTIVRNAAESVEHQVRGHVEVGLVDEPPNQC